MAPIRHLYVLASSSGSVGVASLRMDLGLLRHDLHNSRPGLTSPFFQTSNFKGRGAEGKSMLKVCNFTGHGIRLPRGPTISTYITSEMAISNAVRSSWKRGYNDYFSRPMTIVRLKFTSFNGQPLLGYRSFRLSS